MPTSAPGPRADRRCCSHCGPLRCWTMEEFLFRAFHPAPEAKRHHNYSATSRGAVAERLRYPGRPRGKGVERPWRSSACPGTIGPCDGRCGRPGADWREFAAAADGIRFVNIGGGRTAGDLAVGVSGGDRWWLRCSDAAMACVSRARRFTAQNFFPTRASRRLPIPEAEARPVRDCPTCTIGFLRLMFQPRASVFCGPRLLPRHRR